jgi:excisionase family DNA binding protein
MSKEKEYSLKEAAKLLGISAQTVKRRIDRGEIKAKKEVTTLGIEMWLIPQSEIKTPPLNREVEVLTNEPEVIDKPDISEKKKQINIYQIQKVVQNVLQAQTNEIKTYIDKLEKKIDKQEKLIEDQRKNMNDHYRLVDERLRLFMKERETVTAKPFWKRIFSS